MKKALKPLVANLFEDLIELVAAEILERTEVREMHRYGPHVRTVYNDGRETLHTTKRYPGEETGVSAYELMQLGAKVRDLYPTTLPLWARAGIGMGAMSAAALGFLMPSFKDKETP